MQEKKRMYKASIIKPYFDIQGRKYITFELENKTQLQIKVPFRYNRVMCTVHGHIPVQEFGVGENVYITFETKKWNGLEYYVLKSICPSSPDTEKP